MNFAPPITRRNHGRGHSYRDANGLKVPGVTTIINKGVPKQLTNWAAETVAAHAIDHWDELTDLPISARFKRLKGAHNAERDAAAVRGTKVHALAVRLEAGETVSVPEELEGHVASYVDFLDDWNPTSIVTETPVISYKHGYAGTLDLIADVPGIGRMLLDIKTSRSGVYGETALQLAAYRYADIYLDGDGKEIDLPPVTETAVVWVRADGYDLVPVEAGPDQFRTFLYAAQIAAFCEGARDLIGEPLTIPAVAA
ncbi:hypothetical protein AB1484_27345 [Parafrankia sp. FMc6]|uniref:hypothetical protein n=1 Tax=Parafrankia soli TaxID=2599596 RepID=UPI0034D49BDE